MGLTYIRGIKFLEQIYIILQQVWRLVVEALAELGSVWATLTTEIAHQGFQIMRRSSFEFHKPREARSAPVAQRPVLGAVGCTCRPVPTKNGPDDFVGANDEAARENPQLHNRQARELLKLPGIPLA